MTGLTRRQFAGSLAAAAVPPSPRWNVILITNDQHRADCLGAAGNPVIRTPNLDRMAAEGARFEAHYTQCPQCVPARSALHTGRYPHVNRTPTNLYRLPETEQTLAVILGRQGYETAAVGEMPFAPTKFTGGFQRIAASDSEYNAFLRAGGWEAKARQHAADLKTRFQAWPAPWPEEADETAFYAGKTIEFLQAPRQKPFFLHINFRRPHHPFDPPAPFDAMYGGAKFPASHRGGDEMRNKPPGQRKALENSVGFDLRTMTAQDLDRIKSHYYGMISLNDKYIGKVLEHLDRSGLGERTLVVFTSDHGEMLGDHGLLFKGGYFYDEVVHVPLIFRAPGKVMAGRRFRALSEAIDVAPTILSLLGAQAPSGMQGGDLFQERSKRTVYSEFPTIKMLRTEEWKLVHYLHAPYGELYNLREDPHELRNLYDESTHARRRAEMEAALADWLVDSQDPLLKPVPA